MGKSVLPISTKGRCNILLKDAFIIQTEGYNMLPHEYVDDLKSAGFRISMARKGNPYVRPTTWKVSIRWQKPEN